MTARVAVVVFPGTNSEDETQRALAAAGLDAEIVHWSRGSAALRAFDALHETWSAPLRDFYASAPAAGVA